MDAWLALYKYYTKNPDVIAFIEQFENLRPLPNFARLSHPGNSKPLVDLFTNTQVEENGTLLKPETLASLFHANVLMVAKMSASGTINPLQNKPEHFAKIFWKGLYCDVREMSEVV
jgi:hypothetical protein